MSGSAKQWLDAWHVNPSTNKAYDFIDGLRGIAILLVIACHMFYFDPRATGLVRFIGGVFGAGAFGVTLFFTLSGFLISWPFWKRKADGGSRVVPSGYGWRRFWKIYPPLALSIVLFTPCYLLWTHDPAFLVLALKWLTGLAWFVPVQGDMNPAMWSLLVEVHFYLLLPLLFICVKKVPPRASLWLLFLIFLVVPTGYRWLNAARGVYFTLHPDINVHFPSLLDAFAFGVLLAGMENLGMIRKSWARFGDLGLLLLGCNLFLCSWLNQQQIFEPQTRKEVTDWVVKFASALALCYVADADHPRVRLLSSQWLRWCGIISYEWYLVHQPIVVWAKSAFGPSRSDPRLIAGLKYGLTVFGSLMVGLVVAAVVYRYFSLPILRRGRARHSPDRPRANPGSPGELQKVQSGRAS